MLELKYNNELYHHGIKGMKWGVRRYQNEDGTLTAAGKKHYSVSGNSNNKNSRRVKIVVASAAALSIAAAATVYGSNKNVRNIVNSSISKFGKNTIDALKKGGQKSIDLGKRYTKEAVNGVKEGVREGIKEAPKKAAKAIVIGIGMNAAKRLLDKSVGKEEAARIFKANNPKKIDSFWKVSQEDKDDD